MVVNSANARIFGSDDDAVFVGPLGTTLPTGLAAPEAPLEDAGWLGPDGIAIGGDSSVNRFRGHQGARVVRTKMGESSTTFTFQCLETTALTLGLQVNMKAKATASGVTTATVSAGKKVEARAFVIDVYDEDDATIHYRYLIPRGEIGERSDFTLGNSDITGYSFTVEVIGDYTIITNDEAIVEA